MEPIDELLNLLGSNLRTEHKGDYIYYKGFKVRDHHRYYAHLGQLKNDFKIAVVKQFETLDLFDILMRIANAQEALMFFYQIELLSIEPVETGIDTPEVLQWEAHEKKRYRDNGLYFLSLIVRHEIEETRDLKRFLVQTIKANKKKEVEVIDFNESALLEPIIFEGSQNTLVALFYALTKLRRLTINIKKLYPSDQKHLEDFLQKNFSYRHQQDAVKVKNASVAISRLIAQHEPTADTGKEKVLALVNEAIEFWSEFKSELEGVELRHKESE